VSLLHYRVLNGWSLFWLIGISTFAAISAGYVLIGVSTPEAAVDMIRLSVQLASPWVYLAFVASPMSELYPGSLSKWLVTNRRYIGLSFAAGFGWQAVFIAILLVLHAPYYWEELHNSIDLLLRMASYIFLLAMTITSFFAVRRTMRPAHWRWLHWVGIWYFWAAIWGSYAPVAFSSDARMIDIVYTLMGLVVLLFRITAYLKVRSRGLPKRSELL